MRHIFVFIILLLSSFTLISNSYSYSHNHNEIPVLEGPYLGQKPPGLTPELFAPGIVSTENLEVMGVFGPVMDEFYFLRQIIGEGANTFVIQLKNGVWQTSVVETTSGLGEIFISTDGKTMHLGKEYRERTDTGWSEMKNLGPLFDKFSIMRLTASAAGTYVFDELDDIGTIRYSQLIEGKREEPKAFNKDINSGTFTAHPFIAPDESYLIWDSEREGGHGETDLYISFRAEDGSWGPAINMGENINTDHEDAYGSVTSDGKYFIFQRTNLSEKKANIFWVDAQFIETLRPKP